MDLTITQTDGQGDSYIPLPPHPLPEILQQEYEINFGKKKNNNFKTKSTSPDVEKVNDSNDRKKIRTIYSLLLHVYAFIKE